MRIFILSMAIFMIPSKKPVMQMVSCKMIENGYCVFRRLLISARAINCAVCLSLSWCIVLLWTLITYGRHPRTISVMIYSTISFTPSIFLSLPRIRSMIMDCIS